MISNRLKSEIRVQAYLRRCSVNNVAGVVVQRGDEDAGAIAIKVYNCAGKAELFVESYDDEGEPYWRSRFDGFVDEVTVDAHLEKERNFDRDLWIVEIEDREGRNFLDD